MKNKFFRIFIPVLAVIGLMTVFGNFYYMDTIISLAIFFGIVFLVIKLLSRINKTGDTKDNLPNLSSEKHQHYHDLGMSDQEITFFRETMNTTKKQIVKLERNMNSVPKLKAISLRNETIKVAKAMFKELVKEPNKLHLADGFLYNHLPNLVELTTKYIEINQHDVKTRNSFEALDKSAKMIDKVSQLLLADYEKFVSDDIEDLDVELTIAEQNISRSEQKITPETDDTDQKE
ncbi:5-bromo-4-chloroindolyl phosphate hydrolysis family protein [Vagococcus elongatus]|uniref:5-bromo-4-chloroindolyl phosphate hydrolysis protein n=1 Tax=Vagococcus elongatus TaxID=180344 RepID=A0A430AYI1_9ENTE|nr:5-bromo-4-chloroindolyl phosphate hydrolysis family protein [Vagococcus elongatus]RSU13123.1 hypothetical protein CBF29_05490 [Vagococcus elongatus]